MIVFGHKDFKPGYREKLFNLSSISELGEKIFSLLPPFKVDDYNNEKDFDIMYATYILENNAPFIDMMKVIYSQYESGEDVINYILIEDDEFRNSITESLIKFIQQRYGYNCSIIHDHDDIYYIEESTFDINGLFNLDQDKERYVLLIAEELNNENKEDADNVF